MPKHTAADSLVFVNRLLSTLDLPAFVAVTADEHNRARVGGLLQLIQEVIGVVADEVEAHGLTDATHYSGGTPIEQTEIVPVGSEDSSGLTATHTEVRTTVLHPTGFPAASTRGGAA